MIPEAVVAVFGAAVIAVVDMLILLRVVRAYVRTRRHAHLIIVGGIASSYLAVVGSCIVLAAHGVPELGAGAPWEFARYASFTGAALAYGCVGLFAAETFGSSRAAVPLAMLALVGLLALAVAGVRIEAESVATPATCAWSLRIPFVGLSLAGSLGGGIRASDLTHAYARAREAGRPVDGVALGRMRAMQSGFLIMAAGQTALLGFAPGGGFTDVKGLLLVALVMLGGLGFALACVATWVTPDWLRRRWERT